MGYLADPTVIDFEWFAPCGIGPDSACLLQMRGRLGIHFLGLRRPLQHEPNILLKGGEKGQPDGQRVVGEFFGFHLFDGIFFGFGSRNRRECRLGRRW